MILAEVGFETIAGGGVTAMLVTVMVAFLRRTKETDDRRDAGMQIVLAAAERENERLIAERDAAREEVQRIREAWEAEIRRHAAALEQHDRLLAERNQALAELKRLRSRREDRRQR